MHANLKTLSRQYANGMLSRQDYRRARAELLEGVLGGHDQTEPQTTAPAPTEPAQSSKANEGEDS